MSILKQWWASHGTKILGFGTALIGMLAFIDQGTLQLIDSAFGPVWGKKISLLVMMVSGLSTAWRGFTNSKKV